MGYIRDLSKATMSLEEEDYVVARREYELALVMMTRAKQTIEAATDILAKAKTAYDATSKAAGIGL